MSRPEPLDAATRRRMESQQRRNTRPEIALRSELHRRGLRFRVERPPLVGMRSRADVVFVAARVAVFVDGCFWHSCPAHGSEPKNNHEWWARKLKSNVARDERIRRTLAEAGWLALRIWEHEDVTAAADAVERAVRGRPSRRALPDR